MAQPDSTDIQPTLGELIRHERLRAGIAFRALSEQSGVSLGQLHKLEGDKIQKPNPAHLAAIAGPLNVPLSHLYTAAGYGTDELPDSDLQLTRKLKRLSPTALASVAHLVDEFLATTEIGGLPIAETVEAEFADEPDHEKEGGSLYE